MHVPKEAAKLQRPANKLHLSSLAPVVPQNVPLIIYGVNRSPVTITCVCCQALRKTTPNYTVFPYNYFPGYHQIPIVLVFQF